MIFDRKCEVKTNYDHNLLALHEKHFDMMKMAEKQQMDMEVFAPCDGTVAEVCLAAGSSVQKGQAIVKLA